MKTYATSTITSKGQITLPAAFRAAMKLTPGKQVEMNMHGNTLTIVAPMSIEALRASNKEYMRQHGIKMPTKEQIDAVKTDEYRNKYLKGSL
ncbi:MAG: AbrB/MazE/SpoVT family DNA-binding domain-containing protein [Candidatus Saccharimonadales bacterium]